MATLLEIGVIYTTPDTDPLFSRFKAAVLIAARDIRAEEPNTTNHGPRVDWANVVFNGDDSQINPLVRRHLRYAIASNSTFQSSGDQIDDSGIQFIVNSQIDALL